MKIDLSETRLAVYIRVAMESPILKDVAWDSIRWRLDLLKHSNRCERFHGGSEHRFIFATLESSKINSRYGEREPIVEPFASFAKAVVARKLNADGTTRLYHLVACLRHLDYALRTSGKSSITALTLRDFHLAEESILKRHKGQTCYNLACALAFVAKEVDIHRLAKTRIGYINRIKSRHQGDGVSLEEQEIGNAKMVSDDVLARLADISAAPPDDLNDRTAIRVVDLLFSLGFRIGEILTLRQDCWVVSDTEIVINPATGEKRRHEGIRYVSEKTWRCEVKWIETYAVELVRRAVDDLNRIGGPAREMSRWMEAHPRRLRPLADLDPDSLIEGVEACARLGLDQQSMNVWKSFRRTRAPARYRVSDIEEYYLRMRGSTIVMKMSGAKAQLLSDSLIVTFRAKGGDAGGARRYYIWLPIPMKYPSFSRILCKSKGHSRPALLPPDLNASSKQFRHWLNTKADEGGLSDIDLMKWMGRKTIAQNYAYKHGTVARRVELTKQLIREGRTYGKVGRVAAGLLGRDLEDFLDGQIEAVHVMPIGLCTHNFASTPCQEHHECLRGCGDYLRVKNDYEQRTALLELQRKQLAILEYTQRLLLDGFFGADKWIANASEHLRGIEAALAIDDPTSAEGSTGALVPVFPGAPSKRKALE